MQPTKLNVDKLAKGVSAALYGKDPDGMLVPIAADADGNLYGNVLARMPGTIQLGPVAGYSDDSFSPLADTLATYADTSPNVSFFLGDGTTPLDIRTKGVKVGDVITFKSAAAVIRTIKTIASDGLTGTVTVNFATTEAAGVDVTPQYSVWQRVPFASGTVIPFMQVLSGTLTDVDTILTLQVCLAPDPNTTGAFAAGADIEVASAGTEVVGSVAAGTAITDATQKVCPWFRYKLAVGTGSSPVIACFLAGETSRINPA